MQRLSQIQGIGRRTGNTRHSKVSQQTDMFLRIPGRSRQYGSPQMLHTVMGTQSARKQPVAISHGNDVSTRHAIGRQRTCYHVLSKSPGHDKYNLRWWIARRAGRGMDTDYLGHGRSQQAHLDNLSRKSALVVKGNFTMSSIVRISSGSKSISCILARRKACYVYTKSTSLCSRFPCKSRNSSRLIHSLFLFQIMFFHFVCNRPCGLISIQIYSLNLKG